MSTEHQPVSPEHHEQAAEELEAAGREQLEQLRTTPEANVEHPEHRAEAAREVIAQQTEAEEAPPPPAEPTQPSRLPFLNPKLNYAQTLASLQRKLSPASRRFSKFIHNPTVEQTSDALERTVARPSVMLGATWTALILGTVFYFGARHYGYTLSGSELLFSFVVGAMLGIGVEAIWHVITSKRS